MNGSRRQLLEAIWIVTQELEQLAKTAPGLTHPDVIAVSRKLDQLVMEWYRRAEDKSGAQCSGAHAGESQEGGVEGPG